MPHKHEIFGCLNESRKTRRNIEMKKLLFFRKFDETLRTRELLKASNWLRGRILMPFKTFFLNSHLSREIFLQSDRSRENFASIIQFPAVSSLSKG